MSNKLTLKELRQAQNLINSDEAFRQLGSIDTRMALKVGTTTCLVSFEGFSCHDVRKISKQELRDSDFLVEMSTEQWHRFMAGCRTHQGPTLVQFDATEGVVQAAGARERLRCLRYHTSLQAFFEACAAA